MRLWLCKTLKIYRVGNFFVQTLDKGGNKLYNNIMYHNRFLRPFILVEMGKNAEESYVSTS